MSVLEEQDKTIFDMLRNKNSLYEDDISEITCDVKAKPPRVEFICDETLNSCFGETFSLPNASSYGESSSESDEEDEEEQKFLTQA